MRNFDVVIVGAGTAGLMLARELSNVKKRTLVLDRKKHLLDFSFNTLASFINLEDFNLSDNVVAQKINKITFHSNKVKSSLKANLYTLDKKKVHEELIESINDKYVTFQLNTNIKSIIADDNQNFTTVVDQNKTAYTAKLFVDASGTNGVLSKKVGLIPKKTQLATGVEYNVKYKGNCKEIFLLIGEMYQGGYGWIFPLQNDRAIIGFGTFDENIVKDLKNRLHQILEIPMIKNLVEKDNDKAEGGSIPITPVLENFVVQNLVCVGDSVSQVNPIVGEGYKFIFESAIMASKAIIKTLKSENLEHLKEYEVLWKNRFSKNYKRSKRSQERFFKYSQNNFVMDFIVFLSKLISSKRSIRSLSGEYGLEEK